MKITKQLIRMLLLGVVISATAHVVLFMLIRGINPALGDSPVFIGLLAGGVNSIVFGIGFWRYFRKYEINH